ncbi:7247_t:CDS:2, partial [Gigaspora margarita]
MLCLSNELIFSKSIKYEQALGFNFLQYQLDNTNFTELNSFDNESKSEDIEEQVSNEGNVYKKSEELWKKLLDQGNKEQKNAVADLNYNLDVDIHEYLFAQMHSAMDIKAKWNI